MSVFDFPRLRFSGIMRINVGTGNNDDYSSTPSPSDSNLLFKETEEHLHSFDSVSVTMTDKPDLPPDEYLEWMKNLQKDQFIEEKSRKVVDVTPGYWNFFGSMSIWADQIKLNGVTLAPGNDIADPNATEDTFVRRVLGGTISYDRWPQLPLQNGQNPKERAEQLTTAIMTDIKSEGSSPGSQIFADNILLQDAAGQPVFYRNAGNSNTYDSTGSKPTKSSANYLASQGYECFYAGTYENNLALNPAAAASFQCAMPFSDDFVGREFRDFINRYADKSKGTVQGIIVRYNMYLGVHYVNAPAEWAELYNQEDFFDRLNERFCPVVGVVTPWYGEQDDDGQPDLNSITIGREIHAVPKLAMKTIKWNKEEPFPLHISPMIARLGQVDSQPILSLDVSKAMTGYFPNVAGNLSLCVGKNAADTQPLTIGTIPYGNPDNLRWVDPENQWKILADSSEQLFEPPQEGIVDYTLSQELFAVLSGENPDYPDGGTLMVCTDSPLFSSANVPVTTIMEEPDYAVIHNARTFYTEQALPGEPAEQRLFLYDGPELIPAAFQILKKGKIITELPADTNFYLLTCKTVPLPEAYNNPLVSKKIESLDDLTLTVDVSQPGSFRYAVVQESELETFKIFKDLDILPVVVAQVRILPNEDYSEYYIDPNAAEPVGNEKLTFEVMYEKVLKPYHVMYPAMDNVRSLHDPEEWGGGDSARRLMERIDVANFNRSVYMPRTRDLSESRRRLMQAWCRKSLVGGNNLV